MNYKIKQVEPNIGRRERKYVMDCLKRRWITEGKYAELFLEKIREYTEINYAVLAPSGTLALYMALHAIGIKSGDKVLVPDITFNATASILPFLGATPVFCDVDKETMQMDVTQVEDAIDDFDIKAIVPVHLYGQPVDMKPLLEIAERKNIPIMEDAAQGLGVKYFMNGVYHHTGTMGKAGIFAFYADKNIICFPGETRIIVKKSDSKGSGKSCTKRIDELNIGDEVLSYNEKTGEKEYDKISKKQHRNANKLIILKFSNGNELITTENHPIYVVSQGWKEASNLKIGEQVIQLKYHGLLTRKMSLYQTGKSFSQRMGADRAKKWGKEHSEKIKLIHANPNSNYSKMYTDEWKKKIGAGNKGKIITSEQKKKMSKAQQRRWTNITGEDRKKHGRKIKEFWDGNEDARKQKSEIAKELAKNPAYIKKVSEGVRKAMQNPSYWEHYYKGQNMKPNKQEKKLEEIIEGVCPSEFKYNGDFRLKMMIDALIPDFVNVNGKKKLIELFGVHWHKPEEEKTRITRYKKQGFDCLILWDLELKNIAEVKQKIQTFVFNPNVELPKITEIKKIDRSCEVYNITTEKNNNYFAYGILVHNCGEGGVVVTNDEKTYLNLKYLRNQGRLQSGAFQHERLGMNFRVTDMQCAVGYAQMQRMNQIFFKKIIIYAWYEMYMPKEVTMMKVIPNCIHIPLRCPILVDDKKKVMAHLQESGVQVRELEYPLHRQPCWSYLRYEKDAFPNANYLSEHGMNLPIHTKISKKDVRYVCEKIQEAL